MASFFKNKSKIVFLIFGILIAAYIIYAMAFMTSYSHIHVIFKVAEGTGEISFPYLSGKIGSTNVSNLYPQLYFMQSQSIPAGLESGSFVLKYARTIYDFNNDLNSFNDYLVAVGIVSLVGLAFFAIFSNTSRRIYYKSNLIIGFIVPLVIIVMSFIAIILSVNLMAAFSENETLYKVVSVLQNPFYQSETEFSSLIKADCDILSYAGNTNLLGLIVSMLFSILLVAYSVFIAIFTALKYKKTGKERGEIIERAVTAND